MTQTELAPAATPPVESNRPTKTTRPVRGEVRMLLKLASVDLLCEFDSMLSRSVARRLADDLGEVGGTVKQTIQRSLEFADLHLTGKSHQDLTRRAERASQLAEELPRAVTACSWDGIRRVVGYAPVSEVDVMRIHSELGKAAAVVAVTAIAPAIESLGKQSRSGTQLLKCLKLFTAELQREW